MACLHVDEYGELQVFVQPFPATGEKRQISSDGDPSRDGGAMATSSSISRPITS